MRVPRSPIPFIHSVFRIEEFADFLENMPAPEQDFTEGNISVTFIDKIFQFIEPGEERMFIILRTDGYNYNEIAWLSGTTKNHVERVVHHIREKLHKEGYGSHLTQGE